MTGSILVAGHRPRQEAIAAVVRGLGARSCFEFGCFTGPVLSLPPSPASRSPVAMSAITLSPSPIRIYARDALRRPAGPRNRPQVRRHRLHGCARASQPAASRRYIARLAWLLEENGRVYLNSPMWGHDEVFGIAARTVPARMALGRRQQLLARVAVRRDRMAGAWTSDLGESELVDREVRRTRIAARCRRRTGHPPPAGLVFRQSRPGRRSLFVLYWPGRTAVLDRRYDAPRCRSRSFARTCTVNRGPNQS